MAPGVIPCRKPTSPAQCSTSMNTSTGCASPVGSGTQIVLPSTITPSTTSATPVLFGAAAATAPADGMSPASTPSAASGQSTTTAASATLSKSPARNATPNPASTTSAHASTPPS